MQVRGQQWLVTEVSPSRLRADELAASRVPGSSLVRLSSVSDDDLGDELTLVWEVEPNRQVLPATDLPAVTADGWDHPVTLGAFLDAVRWGTVASDAALAAHRAHQGSGVLGPQRERPLLLGEREPSVVAGGPHAEADLGVGDAAQGLAGCCQVDLHRHGPPRLGGSPARTVEVVGVPPVRRTR